MSEKWAPKPYQKIGVEWLLKHPAAALFLDPGLGKTSIALKAFSALQKSRAVRKALIVAPKRVCIEVWSQSGEVGKWSDFGGLRVALLRDKGRDDALASDADLYVINPDGLPWLINNGGLRSLLNRGVDLLCVDELSAYKHTRTKRFKLIKPWLGRFKRRWGLTGSPASNGLLDLFGQVYVLDLGARLGRYVTHYRNQYFNPTGFGGYDCKLQEGAEPKIYAKLKDLALSIRTQGNLELPPMNETDLYVSLPPKAAKTYEALEQELVALVDQDLVTAANAAVASGKCRQVASGGLYADEAFGAPKLTTARKVYHLHSAKTYALQELVDELQGDPLLVAYEYEHDLARIRTAFGEDVPAINGGTSDKEGSKIVAAWNAGELPLLCGHPAAMAHGLNLQASAAHVCWYTLSWNLELYDQLNRRIWRQGQKRRTTVHRIIARNTIDEVVAMALRSKTRTQDALFAALKRKVKDGSRSDRQDRGNSNRAKASKGGSALPANRH